MFEDREKAEEAKFQRELERQFRQRARRDRLFGLWAAERLGHAGEAAEGYARALVTAFGPRHDKVILERVSADLAAAGQPLGAAEIAHALARAAERAKDEA
jgi:hypothetical protein